MKWLSVKEHTDHSYKENVVCKILIVLLRERASLASTLLLHSAVLPHALMGQSGLLLLEKNEEPSVKWRTVTVRGWLCPDFKHCSRFL